MHPVRLATMARLAPALAAASHLGIADHLDNKTLSYHEIARLVEAHPDAMLRLLRLLESVGIFKEGASGDFSNTETSRLLQTTHPGTVRNMCIMLGRMYYESWGALLHTVRTGESAAEYALGKPIYEYMCSNPDAAEVFDRAMEEMTRPVATELARRYEFQDAMTVIDVGGGNGALLKGILGAHPHLRGISADRHDVCVRAENELRKSGEISVSDRLKYLGVDFRESIPIGGDIYILKNVLHDWSEPTANLVIENVRRAMIRTVEVSKIRPSSTPRLLVIEPFADSLPDATGRALAHMAYLVIGENGAREHTEHGLREQLGSAGLNVYSTIQLATGHCVIECGIS